jgi:hypothetical protein
MPGRPRYTREEAAGAILRSASWADALRRLGVIPRGKNFATIRKWAGIWGIDTSHLRPARPHGGVPRFTEAQLREAIADSLNWTDVMRRLNRCPSGDSRKTAIKYAELCDISTDHFDPNAARRRAGWARAIPLESILVENSTYASRGNLKKRLYAAGLKQRRCELCGQGELWRGSRMSLILDHVNGKRNDNRIENLRIVCPNCAATLDTHCGRSLPRTRECERCSEIFIPRTKDHRYCSLRCGAGGRRPMTGVPALERRKVERPPYEQLMREIEETSYLAVGRKYGVSDNAIRKWVRFYENERARLEAEADELDEVA